MSIPSRTKRIIGTNHFTNVSRAPLILQKIRTIELLLVMALHQLHILPLLPSFLGQRGVVVFHIKPTFAHLLLFIVIFETVKTYLIIKFINSAVKISLGFHIWLWSLNRFVSLILSHLSQLRVKFFGVRALFVVGAMGGAIYWRLNQDCFWVGDLDGVVLVDLIELTLFDPFLFESLLFFEENLFSSSDLIQFLKPRLLVAEKLIEYLDALRHIA